ncbi:hypothetical protein [Marilutibacter alkalisoli]|uniref:Transcriptional regulator n=1 Tax=Marilutibacter alkalisoli TaxID=2591633 RepID=A0A514BUT6_9GAMM|nr:hypothetical protein [Lysobacter alkalisoli]QDH71173.1 hypothetical protein FKV23_14560 [Lysobacter alkalisoli]
MKKIRVVKMFAALVPAVLFVALAQAGAPMPEQSVQSLEGKQVRLPADLTPCPVLLVIGFTRASSTQTAAWSRRLAIHDACATGLVVYQVAMVEDIPAPFRGLAVRGMRKSVPAALHPRFLLIDAQTPQWRALAGYQDEDDAYLVLLDSDRKVLWRHAGALDPPAEAALQDAVAAAGAP